MRYDETIQHSADRFTSLPTPVDSATPAVHYKVIVRQHTTPQADDLAQAERKRKPKEKPKE